MPRFALLNGTCLIRQPSTPSQNSIATKRLRMGITYLDVGRSFFCPLNSTKRLRCPAVEIESVRQLHEHQARGSIHHSRHMSLTRQVIGNKRLSKSASPLLIVARADFDCAR